MPFHLEYNIGDPNLLNFCFIEDIEGRILLHILIAGSQLIPIETYFKLELNDMILFIDFNNRVKYCTYVDFGR